MSARRNWWPPPEADGANSWKSARSARPSRERITSSSVPSDAPWCAPSAARLDQRCGGQLSARGRSCRAALPYLHAWMLSFDELVARFQKSPRASDECVPLRDVPGRLEESERHEDERRALAGGARQRVVELLAPAEEIEIEVPASEIEFRADERGVTALAVRPETMYVTRRASGWKRSRARSSAIAPGLITCAVQRGETIPAGVCFERRPAREQRDDGRRDRARSPAEGCVGTPDQRSGDEGRGACEQLEVLPPVRRQGDHDERGDERRGRDGTEAALGSRPSSPRETDGYGERDEDENSEWRLPAARAVEEIPSDSEMLESATNRPIGGRARARVVDVVPDRPEIPAELSADAEER